MVLNLASCSTKSNPSVGVSSETAVTDQTVPQETKSKEGLPQELNDAADISQKSEADPLSDKFNGLWITNSSIGTLYYFDSGKVTCYINDNYDPSATDLHYEMAQKENYTVEEVTSEDGSGYKAILKSGNEYWLLDNYPDVLSCYWHDDNGDLQLSGSSSLMRVTDYTVDDLILEGGPADQYNSAEADTGNSMASQSPYSDIVREYANNYGKLTFVNVDGYDYYIGVF